jgi:hypothetical protein
MTGRDMADCNNFRQAGELLCQLIDVSDVLILVRGAADEDEELTLTATRRDGRRLHALAGDVIGLLQDALRDQRRKRCSRCRKVRGEGDFSGGDRWCLPCRRELAGVRRQRKKAARQTAKTPAGEAGAFAGQHQAEPGAGTVPAVLLDQDELDCTMSPGASLNDLQGDGQNPDVTHHHADAAATPVPPASLPPEPNALPSGTATAATDQPPGEPDLPAATPDAAAHGAIPADAALRVV